MTCAAASRRLAAIDWSRTDGIEFLEGVAGQLDSGPRRSLALFRGGFWFNGTSAGVFAVDAFVVPSGSGNTVGFRCAR
jgi:hypothetical protein